MPLKPLSHSAWFGPGLLVTAIVGGFALSNIANAHLRLFPDRYVPGDPALPCGPSGCQFFQAARL